MDDASKVAKLGIEAAARSLLTYGGRLYPADPACAQEWAAEQLAHAILELVEKRNGLTPYALDQPRIVI